MICGLQLTNPENGDRIYDGQNVPIAFKLLVLKVRPPHRMRWNVRGNLCSKEQENGFVFAIADFHPLPAIARPSKGLFA